MTVVVGLTGYTVVKFFHILLAIVAVGFNASYGIWLARASKEPEHELHVVRGIKLLDDRFANPAYGLLLLTGLLMVRYGGLSYSLLWLKTSIGIYIVMGLLAALVYTPTLKKQVQLLEAGSGATAEYKALSQRGSIVGVALAVLVIVILFLMVTKPT
jgi:uncharacterized membrane protein